MEEKRRMIMDITLGSEPMPDIIRVKKDGFETVFVINGQLEARCESRHATIMKQADKIGELIKGIDGRDKTILAWLAKSERQVRHRKRYQQMCADLLAELESWKETAEGNLNMLKDRDSELSTLKQSIEDAPTRDMLKVSNAIYYDIDTASDEECDEYSHVKVALLEIKDGE